jgi:hypothetical protein
MVEGCVSAEVEAYPATVCPTPDEVERATTAKVASELGEIGRLHDVENTVESRNIDCAGARGGPPAVNP